MVTQTGSCRYFRKLEHGFGSKVKNSTCSHHIRLSARREVNQLDDFMYSQKDDVGEKPKLVARKSARLVSRHWDYGPVLQAADAGYEPESKLLYDCKRNAPA
ncbi:hypothetical protein quinque_009471 [Culex quinquefasciatus]